MTQEPKAEGPPAEAKCLLFTEPEQHLRASHSLGTSVHLFIRPINAGHCPVAQTQFKAWGLPKQGVRRDVCVKISQQCKQIR